jgi:hypothetical protein
MTSPANLLKLGPHAHARHYFEYDQEFDPKFVVLVEAYEEAARRAGLSAKHAVKYNTPEFLSEARWFEATVCTLERILGLLESNGDEIQFPNPFKDE